MNLRELQYICAVADTCHFGKAAEAVHVSQPTLSGQIRKLEEELGVALFERTNRSVRLTAVGAEIVAAAREVLRGVAGIQAIAAAQADPMAGPFRLGLIASVAPGLIPRFVPELRRRHPALQPSFVESLTEDLLPRVRDGALDSAVLATEVGEPQLLSIPLYREPFWLAVPVGHELSRRAAPTLDALQPSELLLLTEGHCFRDQALAVCGLNRGPELADVSATSLETLINLVAAGQGITLLPALTAEAVRHAQRELVLLPLADHAAARIVRLVYRKGYVRTALLESLAGVIRAGLPDGLEPLH